jgi:superfamily II DNA or RNA helicase
MDSPPPKKKKCPKGTVRNKKTGLCQGAVPPQPPFPVKSPQGAVPPQPPFQVKSPQGAVPPPISLPRGAEGVEPPRKKCPKGTMRNKKTGLCEPKKGAVPQGVPPPQPPLQSKGPQAVPPQPPFQEPSQAKSPPISLSTGVGAEDMEPPEGEDPTSISLPRGAEGVEPPGVEGVEPPTERLEREALQDNNTYDFLYPNLNDPDFNLKIVERKEFNELRYDGEIHPDISAQADILCNAEFELAPHQLFVRNFLSFQTPYNSLLLYHGLGSGKTCSAISVAEEMRDYIIQMGLTSQIIIVASPNVQENFRRQLFDETKLKMVDGLWNMRSCVGNKILKEINPMNMKGLAKENVVKQVRKIIDTYYSFMGYVEFANDIANNSTGTGTGTGTHKLRRMYSNRLIIIDEVHNIRGDDNKTKRVAEELTKLVKSVDTLRLLFLSGTPMFNSFKEIIWLVNLMNMNDRRAQIEIKQVFNKDGSFKEASADGKTEGGRELLERKATGYISFVRGENPYTFPFRLWPQEFAKQQTFPQRPYPTKQLTGQGSALNKHMEHVSLYLVDLEPYQQQGYNYIISQLKERLPVEDETEEMENIAFGYTALQAPLEGLNIIYPHPRLGEEDLNSRELIGSEGLHRIMDWTENETTHFRTNFKYKPGPAPAGPGPAMAAPGPGPGPVGKIFAPTEIGKYSSKIKTICEKILQAKGVILVYSQFIDAGLLPLALALEELGFARAGNNSSLFATPPVPRKAGLNYAMITGDKGFSPNTAEDIRRVTDDTNFDGSKIKVLLISQTGTEGLDLKFIRQVHIMEPWYNMNRIEQIIGRAVRTCSHKALPFLERNVELYLYASLLENETADLYIYRLAEKKALQIGKVSRVLKEIAVDCVLNQAQTNFEEEKMTFHAVKPVTLQLASGISLPDYKIGDKPFTAICDYLETCAYTCRPNKELEEIQVRLDSYTEDFIMMNTDKLVYKIKKLMKERFFYRKKELIAHLNVLKVYPNDQINAALQHLVEDKNEYLTDKYGRSGHLINIDDLYLFQPLELNDPQSSVFERSRPLDAKLRGVSPLQPPVGARTEGELPERDPRGAEGVEPPRGELPERGVEGVKPPVEPPAELAAKYELATHPQKIKKGEKDWYLFCNLAIEFMKKNGFTETVLFDHVAEHIVDELSLANIQLILNLIEARKPIFETSDLFRRVKKYLLAQIIVGKENLQGLIWKEDGKTAVLVKTTDAAASQRQPWQKAEAEDLNDLDIPMNLKKTTIISNLNKLVGFMNNFKKEEYVVFKTKDITRPRDLGARCDQNSKKGHALSILNEIVGSDMFSTQLDIPQKEICIIQEFYLRNFTREKRLNKHWFLNPAEAVLTNIEQYTTAIKEKKR